jgi:hypothetical protein
MQLFRKGIILFLQGGAEFHLIVGLLLPIRFGFTPCYSRQ